MINTKQMLESAINFEVWLEQIQVCFFFPESIGPHNHKRRIFLKQNFKEEHLFQCRSFDEPKFEYANCSIHYDSVSNTIPDIPILIFNIWIFSV